MLGHADPSSHLILVSLYGYRMLRDSLGRPVDGGDWFVHHGTDVETRWDADVPHLTPTERFFVRNHTRAPEIDVATWRLLVTGDGVLGDRAYSLADLQSFTSTTVERALECAGNGRRLFEEQQGSHRPGHAVGARRDRRRTLDRRPAVDRAASRGPASRRRAGDAGRTRRAVRRGRRRPRPGAPPAPPRQGAGRHAGRLGDERRAAGRRPRLPGAPRGARLGGHREHQVAR